MYVPRIADISLTEALKRSGAVLVQGPKACGKTETATQKAQTVVNADIDPNVKTAMEVNPSMVLEGKTPLLVDEWQEVPDIWNVVKYTVDQRKEPGQFILTGSTVPTESKARHSGAGRIARLTMSTLSFLESGDAEPLVSLREISKDESIQAASAQLDVKGIAQRIARGGWPGNLGHGDDAIRKNNRDYLQTVAAVELEELTGVKHNPARIMQLLRSLSRGIGTEISVSSLSADIDVSRETTYRYLDALERIFISVNQPAWAESSRSRVPLRKAPKRHLADPSLAVAATRHTSSDLMKDLAYLGQLFESQVVHDLKILSGEEIFHARNINNWEVDAIFWFGTRLFLVEIKLGHTQKVVDQAAESLKRFSAQLEVEDPALLVITGSGLSYRRADGVNVVAFGALGQ